MKIVGQISGLSVEAADAFEQLAPHRDGRAERESDALERARRADIGTEGRREADVFEQAGEGPGVRPAVEASHHSDLRAPQRGHYAAKVISLDANVTVGDQQHLVLRFSVHVLQI